VILSQPGLGQEKANHKDLQHYHGRTWKKKNIQAWENKEDRDLLDALESHG
jgi:hypothetical protein